MTESPRELTGDEMAALIHIAEAVGTQCFVRTASDSIRPLIASGLVELLASPGADGWAEARITPRGLTAVSTGRFPADDIDD